MRASSNIHCIQYFPVIKLEDGGVTRFFLDICLLLSHQGVKVTLLTQDAADVPKEWHDDEALPNVCVISKSKSPLGLLSKEAIIDIKKLFDSNTVIHFHVPWLVSNLQISRVAEKYNVPYVITPHGSLDGWSMSQKKFKKSLYWILFAKRMFENAGFVHFTASGEHEQAKKYLNTENVKIIPCVFDTTAYEVLPDKSLAINKFKEISQTKPNILFLSRLHPKKGADILIEASKILIDRNISVNVLIAGPDDNSVKGYSEQLVSSVNSDKLKDNIHFIGMVKGDEKLSLYRNADIFVLPTHQENFGLVLVESMACETPVLTSYGVDIWKEIEQGGAIIVENKAHEVADRIVSLLNDKEKLKNQSIKSREWVLDYLDPEKIANQYISMYSQALR